MRKIKSILFFIVAFAILSGLAASPGFAQSKYSPMIEKLKDAENRMFMHCGRMYQLGFYDATQGKPRNRSAREKDFDFLEIYLTSSVLLEGLHQCYDMGVGEAFKK
jgi:hypothetical protein